MNTLAQFEQQREGAVEQIKLRDAIVRLSEHPDFKYVIRERFIVEDCARFVRETINPMLTEDEQKNALAFAQSAGYLKQWLNMQIQMGNGAESAMLDLDNAIDDVRAEEAEQD
jgi:hypothetical protein